MPGYFECFQERIKITEMLDEGVRPRPAVGKLFGVAHADEIGRDTAPEPLKVRNHIAPYIGGSGIAMQEDDGVSDTDLDIGHAMTEDRYALFLVGKRGLNHDAILPFFIRSRCHEVSEWLLTES